MGFSVFIYGFLSLFYVGLGVNTYNINRKSRANKIFLAISSTLALWSMLLALMSMSDNPETASFFRWIMTVCWSSLYLEILLFALETSGIWKKINHKFLIRIPLYIPAIFNFFFYFSQPIPSDYLIRLPGAWAYQFPLDRGLFYNHYFTAYYLIYMLLSIGLLFYTSNKATHTRQKKQATIILWSLIVVGVISSFPDIILPNLGYTQIPPVTVVISFLSFLAIWFTIRRYSFLSFSDEKLFLELSMIMNEGFIILSENNLIQNINLGARKILGINPETPINQIKLDRYFDENFLNSGESLSGIKAHVNNFKGDRIPVLISIAEIRDTFKEGIGQVIYFQDISELNEAEKTIIKERNQLKTLVQQKTKSLRDTNEQLKNEIDLRKIKEQEITRLAYRDHLTGLPNRRVLNEHLKREIERTLRTNTPFAVLFLDLDGFKLVNDSWGHSAGDELLIEVANRISSTIRQSDIVARLGGDEFAIILFNPNDNEAIGRICAQLINSLKIPFKLNGSSVHLSASIGVSRCPDDGTDPSILLQNADLAMYEAKQLGTGTFSFFEMEARHELEEIMKFTNDLYYALDNNELEIYYQPKVSSHHKQLIGFEALLRWNHPEFGLLPPLKFIKIAERTGQIIPIGHWVLKSSCEQLKKWNDAFSTAFSMAINLSVKQLQKPNIAEDIIEVINTTKIDPSLIDLEITESMLMKKVDQTIAVLNTLADFGVNISVDDFGTEYSSLGYIKHLPINQIKIPKIFIDGIERNKSDESIIISTIHMAKELGLETVAEGVENESQVKLLEKESCDFIQGYYFHKPMNVAGIENLINS